MTIHRSTLFIVAILAVAIAKLETTVQAQPKPKYSDPKKTDADFPLQGEYVPSKGPKEGLAVQVIALGDGEFEAVVYQHGLPGLFKATDNRNFRF